MRQRPSTPALTPLRPLSLALLLCGALLLTHAAWAAPSGKNAGTSASKGSSKASKTAKPAKPKSKAVQKQAIATPLDTCPRSPRPPARKHCKPPRPAPATADCSGA